jgi:hypothetical protein
MYTDIVVRRPKFGNRELASAARRHRALMAAMDADVPPTMMGGSTTRSKILKRQRMDFDEAMKVAHDKKAAYFKTQKLTPEDCDKMKEDGTMPVSIEGVTSSQETETCEHKMEESIEEATRPSSPKAMNQSSATNDTGTIPYPEFPTEGLSNAMNFGLDMHDLDHFLNTANGIQIDTEDDIIPLMDHCQDAYEHALEEERLQALKDDSNDDTIARKLKAKETGAFDFHDAIGRIWSRRCASGIGINYGIDYGIISMMRTIMNRALTKESMTKVRNEVARRLQQTREQEEKENIPS